MFEVVKKGFETSVQDFPGRIGFWNQGFPPSGPMDSWSFRLANLLVGSRYETLQVYLYNMRNDSGHFTSALVISYFMFVLLMTWAANRLNKDKS